MLVIYMKICSTCGLGKDYNEFHKNKKSKDGHKSQCKICILLKEKERRSSNEYKLKQKAYNLSIPAEVKRNNKKKYYLNNREKVLDKNKSWRENNRDKISEMNKNYTINNKESISNRKRKYRENNPNQNKIWRENNPDKVKGYRKKYSKSESIRRHRKNWYKSFKEKNPHILAWRSILTNSLKRLGKNKEDKTIKLLGYSPIELKEHIESLFIEGMSWENYGDWHIDHITPVSHFDSETPADVVNSLENLQPLWAFDNLSKGNKL